jgi:hypothetical protein
MDGPGACDGFLFIDLRRRFGVQNENVISRPSTMRCKQ